VAIEGPELFERCIFWRDRRAETNPCPPHERWQQLRQRLIGGLMERTMLADLMDSPLAGPDAVTRPFVQGKRRRS
jgi:DNA-binding IscR family transcriptional regulator